MKIFSVIDMTEAYPLVQVRMVSEEGVELNEYQCTIDQYATSLFDSFIREYRKVQFAKFQGLKPKPLHDRTETVCLPQNCVVHVWLSQQKNQQLVFIEVPKKKWDVPFFRHDTVFEKVGFPRLLFGYVVKQSHITTMHCLAVKGSGRITEETELYQFPFSNVSGGVVCMGGNHFPEIRHISQLSTMHNLFFSAPSTLCSSTDRNASGIQDLRQLFMALQDQEFPEDWLISKKTCFGDYINKIKATRY